MKFRLVGLLALIAMVLASCGGATPEAGGSSEGIQVHGDWTIDIYNEDGTLDEQVAFSNALVGFGQEHLVRLLAVDASAGSWNFEIGESSTPGSVCPTNGFQGRCLVSPLEIEMLDSDDSGALDTLSLSGSTEVEADGEIQFVRTVLKRCDNLTAPQDCAGTSGTFRTFTEKTLDPAEFVGVGAGQTVQVQVEISFTSG